MKSFKKDFDIILTKLQTRENFAFIRFSDGELFVLQNKSLRLDDTGTWIDDVLAGPTYTAEDYKFFDPSQHQEFRNRLMDSMLHVQNNYFVGISCPCCVSMTNYKWMKTLMQNREYTWANLFVNSNYPKFISEFLPELKKRKIVLICNEKAIIKNSELNIVKDFRIGRNAMIENIDLHLDISKWIEENQIENHVFCFSASSLTNITVNELYKKHSNNTYLDIGTTLNRNFGFPLNRDYLRAYWSEKDHPDLHKTCIFI